MSAGRVVGGKYELVAPLGEGGFGSVWRAVNRASGAPAAVKLLHPSLVSTPDTVERFRREGLVAARLTHPSAIKVFDTGQAEDGTLWIAMEHLVGRTLRARIEEGPMAPDTVVALLEPVCEVLAEAHAAGVFHRDLKPENVMLVRALSGRDIPKVLDFGLAMLVETQDARLTKTGAVVGTPPYMSPEQWDGLRHARGPADVYALGVIAYEMLTARLPFAAESMSGWMKAHHLDAPIPPARWLPAGALPAAMEAAVLAALEKDPARRPAGPMELWCLLRDAARAGAGTGPSAVVAGAAPYARTMPATAPGGPAGGGAPASPFSAAASSWSAATAGPAPPASSAVPPSSVPGPVMLAAAATVGPRRSRAALVVIAAVVTAAAAAAGAIGVRLWASDERAARTGISAGVDDGDGDGDGDGDDGDLRAPHRAEVAGDEEGSASPRHAGAAKDDPPSVITAEATAAAPGTVLAGAAGGGAPVPLAPAASADVSRGASSASAASAAAKAAARRTKGKGERAEPIAAAGAGDEAPGGAIAVRRGTVARGSRAPDDVAPAPAATGAATDAAPAASAAPAGDTAPASLDGVNSYWEGKLFVAGAPRPFRGRIYVYGAPEAGREHIAADVVAGHTYESMGCATYYRIPMKGKVEERRVTFETHRGTDFVNSTCADSVLIRSLIPDGGKVTCTLDGALLACTGAIKGRLHRSKRLASLPDAARWDTVTGP